MPLLAVLWEGSSKFGLQLIYTVFLFKNALTPGKKDTLGRPLSRVAG